jgi:hypothetical protein
MLLKLVEKIRRIIDMFLYILLTVLSVGKPEETSKKVLVNRPGSCVVEDRLHPKTGEVLGKRVRCGI